MTKTEVIAAWDRLVEGSQMATGMLFEHFYPRLVDVVFLRPGAMPAADVEDVKCDAAEIVLIRVLNRPELVEFDTSDPEKQYGRLWAYLKTAAKNQALTLYRRRLPAFRDKADEKTYRSTPDEIGLQEMEQGLADDERKSWLRRMIKEQLTDAQLIVVNGRLFGLSFKEIAEVLGLKEKAAQDRYRRAANKLRRLAAQDFGRDN